MSPYSTCRFANTCVVDNDTYFLCDFDDLVEVGGDPLFFTPVGFGSTSVSLPRAFFTEGIAH